MKRRYTNKCRNVFLCHNACDSKLNIRLIKIKRAFDEIGEILNRRKC